jgi:hypothetical protein
MLVVTEQSLLGGVVPPGGRDRRGRPVAAMEPAVVAGPAVPMLSLSSTGMPCSGPRSSPAASRASAARAWLGAVGSVTSTARTRSFTSAMRRRLRSVSDSLVHAPPRSPWPVRRRAIGFT